MGTNAGGSFFQFFFGRRMPYVFIDKMENQPCRINRAGERAISGDFICILIVVCTLAFLAWTI